MSAHIDHVKVALQWINAQTWQEAGGATDDVIPGLIAIGQVHATLALVEQQRIANLIALARCGVGEFAAEARHGLGEEVLHPDYPPITVPALRPEIRKGLGL